MTHCHDCTHVTKKINRVWTTTCLILSLCALGAGFVLGQLSTVL